MTHASSAVAENSAPAQVCGSDKDVEARFGFKAGTLRTWRYKGGGPPYSKPGRSVVYFFADVEAWLRDHIVTPTSEP